MLWQGKHFHKGEIQVQSKSSSGELTKTDVVSVSGRDCRTATSCIRVKSTKEVVNLGEVKPFLAEITAISPCYV